MERDLDRDSETGTDTDRDRKTDTGGDMDTYTDMERETDIGTCQFPQKKLFLACQLMLKVLHF
jgi:hypothetical protein